MAAAASAAAGLFVDSGRVFSAAFVKDIHRALKKSAGNFDIMDVFMQGLSSASLVQRPGHG
ncbi:MAG: hypothetical protein AAB322_08475 [Pseudomonadota bacterium]